jgi:hypothetical protein
MKLFLLVIAGLLGGQSADAKDSYQTIKGLHCTAVIEREGDEGWILEFDESRLRYFVEAGHQALQALAKQACQSRVAVEMEYDAKTKKVYTLKLAQ